MINVRLSYKTFLLDLQSLIHIGMVETTYFLASKATKYSQIQGQKLNTTKYRAKTFLLDLQSMPHMEWMRQFIWPQYLLWLQIHWDLKRERKSMPHIEVVETILPQKQPFPTMQQSVTLEWINKMFSSNLNVEITRSKLIWQCWLELNEYHFNTLYIHF